MKYIRWWLASVIFLLPLLFVPALFSVYTLPKTVLFLMAVSVGWLALLIPRVIDKIQGESKEEDRLSFDNKRFLILGFFLVIIYLISSLLQNVAAMRLEALTGETAIVLAGVLLLFLLQQIKGRDDKEEEKTQKILMGSFVASAVVLALISIFQYIQVLARFFNWPPLKQNTWTPTGSFLTTLVLILIAIVYLLVRFIRFIKAEKLALLPFAVVLGLLIVLVLGEVLGVMALIESQSRFIGLQNAWIVTVESFKVFKRMVFGIGPDNFQIAYARFRPAIVNSTKVWTDYFLSSFGQYLTLLAEVGALGLAIFVLLVLAIWRYLRTVKEKGSGLGIGAALMTLCLLALVIPFDIHLWFTFFFLLGLLKITAPSGREVGIGQKRSFVNVNYYFVGVLALTLFAGVLYWYSRAVWADALFARSLGAFSRGEGGNAYQTQIRALEKNPHNENYHIAYARTNLALASALSRNNEDLNDQDRQRITIFIQQAIREAKNATALNPFWSGNWRNLANVYQQIIGVAQGADQWAMDALRQAIVLDQVNPNLRIDLGGLLFARGNYDDAQRQFEQAVSLKPDHANAHYNLAVVYEKQEKWTKAALELKTVLSLIEPDSADFQKVQENLKAIEPKLPQPEKPVTGEEQLQSPQPLPTPQISPIELPEEESAPEVPTPEPSLSPSPTE